MQYTDLIIAMFMAAVSAAPTATVLKQRSPSSNACDLSQISQPSAPSPLPAPSGLTLALVAVGKGTQNYTCADSNPRTVPSMVGAKATLYNASCLATASQAYLNIVSHWADKADARDLVDLPIVAHHFFVDTKTPAFNFTDSGLSKFKKAGASNAPHNTTNVPWLFLKEEAGENANKISAVYRVETKDGVAPATCSGMSAGPFTVPYSAQYWFYTA